jgi:DNA gyrase subunit B
LLLTFFFRHMPQLIAAGNLFIACPPLYQVKRGKQARYVMTDEEMDRTLISLGTEEATLHYAGAEIAGDDFVKLLETIREMLRMTKVLARRGFTLAEALELRRGKGERFPKYRGRYHGEDRYFADDADLQNFLAAQTNIEVLEDDITVTASELTENTFLQTEFMFAGEFEKIIKQLGGFKLAPELFLPPEQLVKEKRFLLSGAKTEKGYDTLGEILDGVKDLARTGAGLEIQRYKGLGEMDADQLAETTMNPEKRLIKKVMVEDSPKADQMFSLLMGEIVEPRRKFIEKYALDAQLDV